MSLVLAQKAIQAVLRVGLLRLQKDPSARAQFLDHFKEFDATFMQFNQYASQFNVPIENFQEPVDEMEKFIKRTDFHVNLGFPRLHAQMPEICITLGSDGEGSGVLGSSAGEERDANDRVTVLWASNKNRAAQIHLTDINADSLEIIYMLVDHILVTNRVLLAQMGLNNCEFNAGDVHPEQTGMEAGIFLYERIITVSCDLYQTYKGAFFGPSPVPSFVAASSNLIEEADPLVSDLEDEEIIEETIIDNSVGNEGPYIIGDQIPVDESTNPLFRGMDAEPTPTEPIIRNLAVTTFDQTIVGEFLFEQVSEIPEYFYFVYPKKYGDVFFVDSVEAPVIFLKTEITLQNEAEENIDYFVYRSQNTFTGSKVLTVAKVVI